MQRERADVIAHKERGVVRLASQGDPVVRYRRPSQVEASFQNPEGITNQVGAPSAPYVNQTPKSVRYCCRSAMPQPFCAAPPHHMSPTIVGALVLSAGPKGCREIRLRPGNAVDLVGEHRLLQSAEGERRGPAHGARHEPRGVVARIRRPPRRIERARVRQCAPRSTSRRASRTTWANRPSRTHRSR